MRKQNLEKLFENINNAEDLLIYHLLKKGWKYVNSSRSGILQKNNIFFIAKKYYDGNKYTNFVYTADDIDLIKINSMKDLYDTDIPLQIDFTPVEVNKCSWYVCYKDHVIEKGALTQNQVYLRSWLEGLEVPPENELPKVEKFREMVDLIDSYATKPKYTLAQYYYTPQMVKDKLVNRYVVSEDLPRPGESQDVLCLRCDSDTPIHLPKDKFNLLEHAIDVLNIKKLGETETQVKLQLPFKKGFYYVPLRTLTLFELEQTLSCPILTSSKNVKMIGFLETNSSLDELNGDSEQIKHIYISTDILEILNILQVFTKCSAVIKQVFLEVMSLCRGKVITNFDKLPEEVEQFTLSDVQKRYAYQALNNGLNYTALLNPNLTDKSCNALIGLLTAGVQPLRFIGNPFSPATLSKFNEIAQSGFELDIFLNLPCDDSTLDYYVDNIIEGINEECESLLAQGYTQEQLKYIKRAKSRGEDFSYIEKSDNTIQLYLKDYQHRNHIESALCNELLNSYKLSEKHTEVRFSDLTQESLKEIAAHLFSQVDFQIDNVNWSELQQYILTQSESVCCDAETGILIQICGNLYMTWDSNSITFYNILTPICKILFVNDTALISESEPITNYINFR